MKIVLRRFLITLFFSWLINPLWVGFAHWRGFGADIALQTLLLAQGACVPFQLLLNEGVAAGVTRIALRPSRFLIGALLLAQAVSCSVALFSAGVFERLGWSVALFVVSFLISNGLSFEISRIYYCSVINNAITNRGAAMVGFLPGAVSLVVYSFFFQLRSSGIIADGVWIAFLIPVGAVVQLLYLRLVYGLIDDERTVGHVQVSGILFRNMLLAVLSLSVISVGLTFCRNELSSYAPAYAALILVGLSTLSSVANTITRAQFLMTGLRLNKLLSGVGVGFIMAAIFTQYIFQSAIALAVLLIAFQFLLVAAVDFSRGIFVRPVGSGIFFRNSS